jgi:DNA-binding NtrC family response regulator
MKGLDSLTFIAKNEAMREMIARIDRIVDSDSSVLLIGETGVGKEIVAEYIHRSSSRSQGPFVKLGLSAMPAELLESELFGHEKGAFTSASYEKKGLFEIANSGTIFLDDIDDVPLHIQTKLLRVLESRELMRIGGTIPIPIDVRLITATKVSLKDLVNKGLFRADLFYRINVVPVKIPSLKERRDDILPLVEHFLKQYKRDKNISLSREAVRALIGYSWPGNVRELRNVVQRLSLYVDNEIKLEDLPPEIKSENPVEMLLKACHKCYVDGSMQFDQIVKCLESNLITEALRKTNGNQTKAAKDLGLRLSTFRDKLKKYDLICPRD